MKKFTCYLIIIFAALACTKNYINSSQSINFERNSKKLNSDSSILIGKLPNGLTYYIKSNQKPNDKAELRLVVKAGSILEANDERGVAHFVEHMAFNGTTHFSKNELISYLESVGSRIGPDINAYTSFTETVYSLQVNSTDTVQLNSGLLILKDWAFGISFNETDVDQERSVIISEWRNRLGAEQRMLEQYFPFILYNSHYTERFPIGDTNIIQHVSHEKIKAFYKKWYQPDEMAIIVVGDIDVNTIENKIQYHFNKISKSRSFKTELLGNDPLKHPTFIKVITDPEATKTNIQIIYKHPKLSISTEGDYRQKLITDLLIRLLNNRLYERTLESNAPFLTGKASYGYYLDNINVYKLEARTDPRTVRKAFISLIEESQRILLHGFTETEIIREKKAVLREAEFQFTEATNLESKFIAKEIIDNYLISVPLISIKNNLELIKRLLPTINKVDLTVQSNKLISNQNNIIILTGPEREKDKFPDSTELESIIKNIFNSSLTAYVDIDISDPLLNEELDETEIFNEAIDSQLNIYSWRLLNGISVSAKPTIFKDNEILMNGFSLGGHSLYETNLFHSARFAATIIAKSGVGLYNGYALDKKLTALNLSVSPFISECYEGFIGSSSHNGLKNMLELVYLYTTQFNQDTTAFNSYMNNQKGKLSNRLLNPHNWFSDKISKITNNYHPRKGNPSLESYNRANLNDMVKVYKDRFSDLEDMHFFFVGDFHIDTIKKLTSQYLAHLPTNGRKEACVDIGVRLPEGNIDSTFYIGEAPKSLIQLIYHGEQMYDLDSSLLLQSLIKVAEIKLRESLREEHGGVYSVMIGGGLIKHPINEFSIRVNFSTDPDRATDLIKISKRELNNMKIELSTIDLNKAKAKLISERTQNLGENQFWMGILTNSWMNDTDIHLDGELPIFKERLESITPEKLKKAAKKFFCEDNLISLTVLPDNSK